MLKRTITYEDFDGVSQTEVFYFNLSKSEIVELEVEYKDGLEATLKRIVAEGDNKKLVEEWKKIVLLTYGVKSEDGKRFIKSDQLRTEFTQTPAYDALFMELATDAKAAADFINGVIPKDLAAQVANVQPQDKPAGGPPQIAPPLPPTA